MCIRDRINTIVRASPGLMIMKKGLIVAKWSRWSFPFDLHLGCNMNELITSSPSSERIGPIILAVLLLLLPMIVFKIKDKRINNQFTKWKEILFTCWLCFLQPAQAWSSRTKPSKRSSRARCPIAHITSTCDIMVRRRQTQRKEYIFR